MSPPRDKTGILREVPAAPAFVEVSRATSRRGHHGLAPIKVLVLASNPTSTTQLDLAREVRHIEERIGVGKPRGSIELVARWAVRPGDLRPLLEEQPHVLHFSGHGSVREQLLLEDASGGAARVEKEALAELIGIVGGNLRLVVLNACDTEPHAGALVEHVDCAIGMRKTIGEEAAIAFAGSFYQALGLGEPVATAFRLGCNELRLQRIPEEETPRLEVKKGVDAATLVLVREPDRSPGIHVKIALALVAVLGICGVGLAWFFMHREGAPPVVAERPEPTPPLPPIDPFEPDERGVVVGGPWLATADGDKLCGELKELDAHHAVRCVAFPLRGSSAEDFRQEARDAGARVVATITDRGAAQVSAIGWLEKDPLIGGTIAMDLAREADRKRAAVVLNAVARLGGPRPKFLPDRVPCPAIGQEPLDRIALLALLVVPACKAVTIDVRRFEEVCDEANPDADETCALAHYLRAEAEPDPRVARSLLERLRDRGPERFRPVAKLKLARAECEAGDTDEAARAVLDFAEGAGPCLRAKLAEVAACVSFRRARIHGTGRIEELEQLDVESGELGECPSTMRAQALAGRAHWRGHAGRWKAAAVDYQKAYQLDAHPSYRLREAECLLHQKRDREADEILREARDLAGDDRYLLFYAALLEWSAHPYEPAKQSPPGSPDLVSLHGKVPPGEPAISGPLDEDLRGLVCSRTDWSPCVYDVLRRPSSPAELKGALHRDARPGGGGS